MNEYKPQVKGEHTSRLYFSLSSIDFLSALSFSLLYATQYKQLIRRDAGNHISMIIATAQSAHQIPLAIFFSLSLAEGGFSMDPRIEPSRSMLYYVAGLYGKLVSTTAR